MNNYYKTNIYGYWQYDDCIGLGGGIEKYDLVYVFKIKDDMVLALNEEGRVVSFHKTNITKNYFGRPSYKYHKKCELGTSENHKNDCTKCQMYKFKQTVKRWKLRNK